MKRNKPLTKAEVEKLKKGNYAHRNPNRRTRRRALRNPPKPVKPMDNGGEQSIPGGHDLGTSGAVAGRESARVGKQTPLALSSVYGLLSRVGIILFVFVRRLRATALAAFRYLSSGGKLPYR